MKFIRKGVASRLFARLQACLVVVGATVVVVLAMPAIASAWSQYYVWSTYLTPAEYRGSAFNSGIDYNEEDFSPIGSDTMGLTLCYSGGGGCYSVSYAPSGYVYWSDARSISYGAAFCGGCVLE